MPCSMPGLGQQEQAVDYYRPVQHNKKRGGVLGLSRSSIGATTSDSGSGSTRSAAVALG